MRALFTTSLAALFGGCSILSPMPAIELAKAVGSASSTALALGPSRASGTVYHPHPGSRFWCIEFNRDTQVADIVPALQSELQGLGIDSRLYERGSMPLDCATVLHYAAWQRWDQPLWRNDYQPYVYAAALTLRNGNGEVLATTRYELDALGTGKWAGTQRKMAPLVRALVTGFNG